MPFAGSAMGRRSILRSISAGLTLPVLGIAERALAAAPAHDSAAITALDGERMRALAAWTMLTMATPNPVPYGAEIFATGYGVSAGDPAFTGDGASLMRGANAVGPEYDPSAHGEIVTIRLACKKLQSASLRGYTLYTTCEPCPMCMACCLWAGLDRVVYGATIADAAKYGHQIMIPAAEVARRTDLRTTVTGPVEREACLALFTDPRMQEVFARWKAAR